MKYIIALFVIIALPCIMATGETSQQKCQASGQVYICVSSGAKRYHCDRDCRGLAACKHTIKAVSVSTAQSKGLTPCKVCY